MHAYINPAEIYAELYAGKGGLMPADHEVIRDDAQGEDRLDESTVAVIEAARQSARECTETYERIMSLLAEDEPLTGHDAGARKHSKRRPRARTEAEDGPRIRRGRRR